MTSLRITGLAVATMVAAALGACAGHAEETGSAESGMSALDRLIVGRATQYPADTSMRDRFDDLARSQNARRREAWRIAERVLEPVRVDDSALAIPRFQTWYSKEEILPMFDRILRRQTPEELAAHARPTQAAIEEALTWQATRATSMPDWSADRLALRREELAAQGTASVGGPERVLMSPALVAHLYANYDAIIRCIRSFPSPGEAPVSETNFARCVGEEFPPGAAIVKARWVPDNLPLETFDTSAEGLTKTLTAGRWDEPLPPNEKRSTATPGEDAIYTMRLPSGLRLRLVALHIVTKELRDWSWVSLFWSDRPNSDFGADRPASLRGPFGGYKMCAVVDYDERDTGAESSGAPSLDRALAASRAFGPRSWCSNPYLEHGAHNATTNCIGCHQHGGTNETTESILEGPTAFPDGSRGRHRANFPADYLFITSTGMGLAELLKSKADALRP